MAPELGCKFRVRGQLLCLCLRRPSEANIRTIRRRLSVTACSKRADGRKRATEFETSRTPENPSEELQAGSAAAAAMPEVETQIVLPPDVMMGARDVEDAQGTVSAPSRPTSATPDQVIHSVELGLGEADVLLSSGKAELMELVKVQVEKCFRNQGVDISEQKTNNMAALQLGLAAVDVTEIVRGGFAKTATSLGLRPGVAVDLSEGEGLDMEACLREEQPYLVMGSLGQRLQAGAKSIASSVMATGTSFMNILRVYVRCPGGSFVRKPTRQITNSQELAEFLAQRISDRGAQRDPWHRHCALTDGLVCPTAAHPPGLVATILKGLKAEMKKDSILSSVDLIAGGPVPSASVFDAFDEDSLQKVVEHYDNISGEVLPPELVERVRGEEIGWVRSINLYDKVPCSLPLPVRWVDVNRGDKLNYKVRSRIVGKELKAKTKDALLGHELFSSMPPWEMVKSLLSFLVTDEFPGADEELELGIFDISRAHLIPVAARELYVGSSLAMVMWLDASTATCMVSVMPAMGGWNRATVDALGELLGSKYKMRENYRLGFRSHCVREATVLNRVVTLGVGADGVCFVRIEPDRRHVELMLQSPGLAKQLQLPRIVLTWARQSRVWRKAWYILVSVDSGHAAAEFYALVRGGAHGLGLQSFLADLGLHLDIVITSDSSSARAFSQRVGTKVTLLTTYLYNFYIRIFRTDPLEEYGMPELAFQADKKLTPFTLNATYHYISIFNCATSQNVRPALLTVENLRVKPFYGSATEVNAGAANAAAAAANARAEAAERERTQVIQLAASQVGRRDGDSILDGRGVGQPFKFTGKRDAKGKPEQDFAAWSLKMVTFLKAKFSGDVEKVLKWASRQKKVVVDVPVAGDTRTVGYDGVYGEVADDGDRVENLDQIVRNLHAYLISFTTGDAKKIVRNSGSDQGLEAWRRLNNEHDPPSSMRRVSILGQVQDPPRCEKEEALGSALEDWLSKKRQYEEFTDRFGHASVISEDSLMAAMFKLMPKHLEEQLLFRTVGLSGKKDLDAMDVDALQRPGGKGNPNMKCFNCGKPGHKAAECRSQPSAGSGGGAGAGKGKGQGKGKGGFKGKKGKSKGKGKKCINGMEAWGDDSWADDSWADDSWTSQSWTATEVPASQPGAGGIPLGAMDLCSVDATNSSYIVEDCQGQEWIRFNYASGAATTAIPFQLVGEVSLQVHKPLSSAAELSRSHDAVLWEDSGALLPRRSPIARGLRQEYFRLVAFHGDQEVLPLHHEGSLHNFYLRRRDWRQLNPVETGGASSSASGNSRQGEAVEAEEEEFEEPEEMKRVTEVVTPSSRMLADHGLENLAVYRNWCEICVASRGLGQQHRRRAERSRDEEREGPRIFSDYFFMSTEEESTPILGVKFLEIQEPGTALPLGVKFFARFIAETGVKRFLNCSGKEPAILALREVLANDVPILMWIPTFAGEAIARYRRVADGKTPWEREKGTRWKKPALQFSEQIFIKEAVERQGKPKRDWDSSVVPARWATIRGLVLRWVRAPRAIQGVGEPAPRVLPELPVQLELAKSFYVTRKDVRDFGFSVGCRGCENVSAGGETAVGHSAACRKRIFQEVEKTQEGRIQMFRDKMSMAWEKHGAEMEDTEALGEGGAAPKRKKPELAAGGEASSSPGAGVQGVSSNSRPAAVSLLAAVKRSEHPDDPEETVDDSLLKQSRWEKERHGVWKLKRAPENPTEELQAGSAAAAAMPEVETQVVLPPDVMMGARDVEDARGTASAPPGPTSATPDQVMDSVDPGVGEADVLLSRGKAELMELVKVQVENCFRNQGVDISEQDTNNIAALQLELAAVDVMQIVRGGFAKTATSLGLRPGVAVDLSKGEGLDMEACLGKERPYLVMGRGQQHFEADAKFYCEQYNGNRYFLHKPFEVGDLRDDAEAKLLQQLPGVVVVDGPLCRWDVRATNTCTDINYLKNTPLYVRCPGGGFVCKPTRWITNSQKLADFLAQWSLDRGLKTEMKKDSILSSADLIAGGPVPSASVFDAFDEDSLQKAVECYDNISGEVLPLELVEKARGEEIGWVRSRIVGRELRAKTKDALLVHELFSSIMPWEMVKSLLSFLVTDEFPGADEELELGIFYISRAHFMPVAARELYVEISDEDRLPGDGDVVGRLNRNMYGFRDASHGWMEDWQKLLASGGYKMGKANSALFYNAKPQGRGAVHGDDFYVLGSRATVNAMCELLGSKYKMRENYRLGFRSHCVREATVLNRVVTLGVGADGRRFIRIEPDHCNVELMLQSLGLDKNNSKAVATPSVKISDDEFEKRRQSKPLSAAQTSAYRSCLMRGSFLSQDRADLGEAVKSLAQGMAQPRECHWRDLKRPGRYLVGKPSVGLEYHQQTMPKYIRVSVDSDHAADKSTRKSTTDMVQRLGKHRIKTTSNLQSAIGLNVSEAEFYAVVHGGAHGLGLQAFLADLGLHLDIVIESDSSSARAFSQRVGLGKQRHLQTRFLWILERVAANHFSVVKVDTTRNVSDILTKATTAAVIRKHMLSMGLVEVE
ncbi:unnamed protein product, partial [Polarella glacialis]